MAVNRLCASGALTRGKGGLPAAPFLVDASTRVTGQAILTSSSWNEASQESDRIGGPLHVRRSSPACGEPPTPTTTVV